MHREFLSRRLCVLGIAVVMLSCTRTVSEPFNNLDITGANYATKLELPDADGRVRTLADFRGKVTIVFFGFTHCPDVCPTTLAELTQIKRALGKDGERLQGVLVTVDPERDTAEVLKQYMAALDPGFVGLRGSLEQTRATAQEFKVFFAKVPSKDGKSYSMDHTAGSYVFDPQGRVRLFTRYGSGVKPLTEDIKRLLAEA